MGFATAGAGVALLCACARISAQPITISPAADRAIAPARISSSRVRLKYILATTESWFNMASHPKLARPQLGRPQHLLKVQSHQWSQGLQHKLGLLWS